MSDPVLPLARIAARAGLALIALSLAGLAWLWWTDRHRAWEEPRLEPSRFVALRDSARAGDGAETWVVAFQPLCPHCRESLARARREAGASSPPARLAVLLIDCDRTLAARAAAALRIPQVWWDSAGVWRRRWGHRVYGEVLRFDAEGRYRGARTPAP